MIFKFLFIFGFEKFFGIGLQTLGFDKHFDEKTVSRPVGVTHNYHVI